MEFHGVDQSATKNVEGDVKMPFADSENMKRYDIRDCWAVHEIFLPKKDFRFFC